jgi:N-acyl-D-amino-acid deacylase
VLFRGATVVDGTGAERYAADVLVVGDRIASIGRGGLDKLDPREVNATGLVLAPGFVDMHSHTDLAVLAHPGHEAKLSQGVTTEVTGQDGLAFAPVDDATLAVIRRQIAGWHGSFPDELFTWRSTGEYLARLAGGIPLNQAYLVPQGNLRMLVIGNENRPTTAAELDAMRGLLRDGLAAGAVGMSSGLSYTPGMFADTAELEALCAVVAEFGGFYEPHIRGYGGSALEGYAEVIGIARRTGCALHLTHATLNFPANHGRAHELLAMVDAAINDGVDVTLDSYPYLPGSTTLAALLPSWVAAGGPDAMLERLGDPAAREAIRVALDEEGSDGAHGEVVDWSTIQVSGSRSPDAVGRTIHELAGASPPVDTVLELLVADELSTGILMHVGNEENLLAIMQHSQHCGGSDGLLTGERPHPRAWGTFPRYLGHYTRELGLFTLEECIRHLSGTPARRLGWNDRGLVKEGYAADLVLFDPETVIDNATFTEPRLPATGISHVMVNGELVIDGGLRTTALSGRVV